MGTRSRQVQDQIAPKTVIKGQATAHVIAYISRNELTKIVRETPNEKVETWELHIDNSYSKERFRVDIVFTSPIRELLNMQ